MSSDVQRIADFVLQKLEINITMYDASFLAKALEKRKEATKSDTLAGYANFLETDAVEISLLFDSLNNTYSAFFRHPLTFNFIEQAVLPRLAEKKKKAGQKEIRIWSAACSAGQEAYSMAILGHELNKQTNGEINCRIFATDKLPEKIEQAQKGSYTLHDLNKVTLERFHAHFVKKDDKYKVNDDLKGLIDFSVFDLLDENACCPPESIFGNFDLIFCSNLLFYYQPDIRKKILDKINHCLLPGGYLIVGEAEQQIVENFLDYFTNLESPIFKKPK